MCTYKTHIRICRRCSSEDTVLISEQLCSVAKDSGSGIFGSCLSGVSSQRDQTGYKCWQCQDDKTTTPASVSSRSRSSSGSTAGGLGGIGRRRGSSVSVPIGPQGVSSLYGYNNSNGNYHYGSRGQQQQQYQGQQRCVSVSGQQQGQTMREYVPVSVPLSGAGSEQQGEQQQQDLERRLRRIGKMKADPWRYDGRFI